MEREEDGEGEGEEGCWRKDLGEKIGETWKRRTLPSAKNQSRKRRQKIIVMQKGIIKKCPLPYAMIQAKVLLTKEVKTQLGASRMAPKF